MAMNEVSLKDYIQKYDGVAIQPLKCANKYFVLSA